MLFSSLTFLFVFMPVLFVLYTRKWHVWQNSILLVTSLGFYVWGGVSYSIVLVLSILFNYLIGLQVRKHRKKWLVFGIVFNLLILVVFKYLDFFIENINLLFETDLKLLHIPLPLGISFFTFHGISFLTDIYRSPKEEKIRLDDTTLYICFFPQLVAGPIIRYHDIIAQIRSRTMTILKVNEGIQRFIIGLFKKVVIANTMGALADSIMDLSSTSLGASAAWLGILAYTLQIYYDFSGYSDMAIGLGEMLGFRIPENFRYPYIAQSIQDFWRRWHISLSTWFRDYVYIPLGGNRKGNFRTYFNLSFVFLLTGFWHGPTWSFVFWGAFHGFFLIMERLFLGELLKKIPAILRWAYTLLVVMIAWVFFRIENFADGWNYCGVLFNPSAEGKVFFEFLDIEKVIVMVIAILFSAPVFLFLRQKLETLPNPVQATISFVQVNLLIPVLFLYSIMVLVGSSYNPFIYFRF